MNVKLRETGRGQFTTTNGVCRVVRGHRRFKHSTIVDLELAAGAETITATFDLNAAPFADEFAEGIAAFIVRNRQTDFAFRVDSVRKPGVDPTIPFDRLAATEIFHALVWLAPAPTELGLSL